MEYKVNSLKDAIKTCLKKYGYDNSNIDVIKNLIYNAIEGKYKYFTRSNGAREYVMFKYAKNGIINELILSTKLNTNDIDYVIDEYIKKYFSKNTKDILKEQIKENSNLEKITQKIRYLDITVNNEEEFMSKIWDTFIDIFMNKNNSISSEELRYDMVLAALEEIDKYKNYSNIIKPIDLNSDKLTIMDSIRTVNEYVNHESIEDLFILINQNKILSGLLMQNLFDVAYLRRDNNDYLFDKLDKELLRYDEVKDKANAIYSKLTFNDSKISLSRQQIIITLIKNAVLTYMYSKNKEIDDIKKIYCGLKEENNEIIINRLQTNNVLAHNILYYDTNPTKENLVNIIDNLDDKILYFLSNMYVISRSLSESKEQLNSAIFYGTKEEINTYYSLCDKDIIPLLEEKENELEDRKLLVA